MSLIDEALRKQREENERLAVQRTPPADPAPAPTLPPPVPPAPPPQDAAPASRPWLMVAGLFAGGVVLVALLLWLLFYGWTLWQQRTASALASLQTLKATTTNLASTAALVQAIAMETKGATSAPPATVAPTQSVAATPAPTPTPAPKVVESAPPLPAATPPPPLKPPPVIWPRLTISGIIGGGSKGQSAAIINGKTVSPGEVIEGVKVLGIDRQRVRLLYEGEERGLTAGATTE